MYTPLPTPDMPWESISMDYMLGLLSTRKGNDFFFVVVDHFSKMTIMAASKKRITVEATAKVLFKQVWVHFGIPQTIVLVLGMCYILCMSSSFIFFMRREVLGKV
jgi:hypothetical protein